MEIITMAQNIYDNPEFFEGYSRLGRSVEGLEGASEWPAMRALLPDLRWLRVLDLGCGYGWFCRWAREHGAATVLGIDVSEKMLERARASTTDAAISYARADAEHFDVAAASFDLAYSSLALHYIEDLGGLLAKLHDAVAPGGNLVFSVEHPIFMAPSHQGFSLAADGRKIWPLDNYLVEGPRTRDWLAKGVTKQHRTVGTYLNLVLRAGFALTQIEEWGPTEEQIAARPEWAEERHRPYFMLVSARR
jgi:SAM-dependent methyltransferase